MKAGGIWDVIRPGEFIMASRMLRGSRNVPKELQIRETYRPQSSSSIRKPVFPSLAKRVDNFRPAIPPNY
jgi:hypothetical protein